MQLKIQTKPPEGMKSDQREPVQTIKKFDELKSSTYEVVGLPYGGQFKGRDSDGQAFTEDTDAWLSEDKEIPVTYYHGFGPDSPDEWQDPPAVIGTAKFSKKDARGFVFDVRLDPEEKLAKRIINADPNTVKASSGAVGHLVRTDEDNIIKTWPVGELALFDTNNWRKPANELAVFMARSEIAEVKAEAETQAETVDVAPEPIQPIIETDQENIMEDETKEIKQETPAVDIEAIVNKAVGAVEAKFNAMWNEKPLNAPAVIKAENYGDPDPNKAFMHWVKTGERVKGLKAAMGEGTAAVGGVLVPDDFYAGIVEKRNELSIPRRAGALVMQTSRDVINIPVEATSQTYFAQASHDMAAVDENEPTVGQATLNIYPFTKLVKISVDLLDDNAANVNQFLSNSFGRWAAMTENRCTLIGAGTTAPQGVTVGGTAALTFDDTNSIAAAEIPELYYKLPQAYRDGASWVLNDDTVAHLRGLSSSSVFTFGPHEIDESKIMGKPYFASTYMPAYTTTAYKAIVFGNWGLYALGERKGLTVQRLTELYAGNRQVGLLATMRFGGVVMQAEAFAVGKMG